MVCTIDRLPRRVDSALLLPMPGLQHYVTAGDGSLKRDTCTKEAAKVAFMGATPFGLINDVFDALVSGDPSQISASDKVDLAKRGVESGAGTTAVLTGGRAVARNLGAKVSTKRAAKILGVGGKFLGAFGLYLTASDTYNAYKDCVQ